MSVPNPHVYLRGLCRVCRGALREVLNLGDLKLNAFPATPWDLQRIEAIPVVLTICDTCGLAQLDRTVPADWLYREYWYRSGVNEMMRHELVDVVQQARELGQLQEGQVALDIGANDGTLLGTYPEQVHTVAVEPALNLESDWRAFADDGLVGYFPNEELISAYADRCQVVTAIACAYDVENPIAFFRGIYQLLTPTGIAVIQFQDLGQMLEATAFDNICHEHLEYYTLHSLMQIVEPIGLTPIDVQRRAINGGSLRVVLQKRRGTHKPLESVQRQIQLEAMQGLGTTQLKSGDRSALERFTKRVTTAKSLIQELVDRIKHAGHTLDIYGASTKGNILLQVLGIGTAVARQAIDRSPHKEGRLTLTGIPIVGEAEAKRAPADAWLTPIWQFKPSVLEREKWFLEQGGKIIFPLPKVEVVFDGNLYEQTPHTRAVEN